MSSYEDDGPDAVLADLRHITERAQQQENFSAALKAIELRGKYHGLWERRSGASSLGDAEDIIQRYKAARERARQAAAEHENSNVVKLRQ